MLSKFHLRYRPTAIVLESRDLVFKIWRLSGGHLVTAQSKTYRTLIFLSKNGIYKEFRIRTCEHQLCNYSLLEIYKYVNYSFRWRFLVDFL